MEISPPVAGDGVVVVRVDAGEAAPFGGVLVNERTWERIVQNLTKARNSENAKGEGHE
jgi:hypothetical protein